MSLLTILKPIIERAISSIDNPQKKEAARIQYRLDLIAAEPAFRQFVTEYHQFDDEALQCRISRLEAIVDALANQSPAGKETS